ncbi:hypothetical protein AB1Y20_008639 [Prymnesium parvum]|uniref:Uncharacterized protein n=1 Tax=Prymnesium parvum TaxID=97485 RepID=A0AB34ITZ1_PRYPA
MLPSIGSEARALATPRNMTFIAALIGVWTCLLFFLLLFSGAVSTATHASVASNYRLPLAAQRTPPAASLDADDSVERQWTEKLLRDLQSSAADESVAATIAELRASLLSREQRLAEAPRAQLPARAAAAAASADGEAAGAVELPPYDKRNIDELRKAALVATTPREAKAPLPQLLHDMSEALALQKQEQDKLLERLAKLEPQVTNYNPSDIEQLTKAAEQVVAEQGGSSSVEKGGSLPRLLAHLKSALGKKSEEQENLDKKMKRAERKRERAAARAKLLKEIILRRASAIDHVTMLFGELADEIEQSLDDAEAACAEHKGGGSSESAPPWRELLQKLQQLILDELQAASDRNATQAVEILSLREELGRERERHNETAVRCTADVAALQQEMAAARSAQPALSTEGAAPTAVYTDVPSMSAPSVTPTPSVAAEGSAFPLLTPTTTTAASEVPSTAADTPPSSAATEGGTTYSTQGTSAVAPAPTPLTESAASFAAPPPLPASIDANLTGLGSGTSVPSPPALPPPLNSGACVGKHCPSGYIMIDRGDRCTCRPQLAR